MIKEFIATGSTLEAATAAAKTGLNAPAMADIKVEVVEMPKKKVLGLFGGADAKVKAWYDDGKKEVKPQPKAVPKTEKAAPKAPKKQEPKKAAPKKAPKEVRETAPKTEDKPREKATESDINKDIAINYLSTMIKGLKVEGAEITANFADGVLQMEVKCDDYGIIIGRRGETLDALQYLTSLVVKKSCDKYVRVTLNVGDYREKRMDTLKNLAKKNANYVLRTGRRYTFEPMNPYERRIIHTTVQEIEGVESSSIGYGQDRKVVLTPTGGVKPRQKSEPKQNVAPKADRSDLPKFGKIEVSNN